MIETMIVLLPGQARSLAQFARVHMNKRPCSRRPRLAEADAVSLDNRTKIG
jgi:hypothetical protein